MHSKSCWLYDEIRAKNQEVSIQRAPSEEMVEKSLKRLENLVETKREVLEPQIQAKKNYNNIIMLSYYRNNLVHVFINEAEIACTLIGIGSQFELQKGAPIDLVRERLTFL